MKPGYVNKKLKELKEFRAENYRLRELLAQSIEFLEEDLVRRSFAYAAYPLRGGIP
jgi:hypothetical protein